MKTFLLTLISSLFISSQMMDVFRHSQAINTPPSNINSPNQPIELGKVQWNRSLDKGVEMAKSQKKPIFILFQEVPGCATCRNYGQDVLSHPLIVEAIESLFIPVAIYNNKFGSDARTLAEFNEPSWNNPVVRIVDIDKVGLSPRLSGDYTAWAVVESMIQALEALGRPIPIYLSDLSHALLSEQRGTETAVVSMYCFWTGEKELAKGQGVVATQAGFMHGREVVKIAYDPRVTSYTAVLQHAKARNCATEVFSQNAFQTKEAKKLFEASKVKEAGRFRSDREPKYYLSHTPYAYIPMTDYQAMLANSLVGGNQSPNSLLSPRQLALLKTVQAYPDLEWQSAIDVPIIKAWQTVEHIQSKTP